MIAARRRLACGLFLLVAFVACAATAQTPITISATTIDAFRKELLAPIAGQQPLLIQAAQVLSQKDVRRILTVRVMNNGGAAIKRSNLFFLTPRFSYVATGSVDYVLTDRESGTVLWHAVRQVRAQLNQKYSPWRGQDVKVLAPQTSRVP